MAVLNIEELRALREQIVKVIADNPEALISDDTVDYATILELARVTGKTDLLKLAFDKVSHLSGNEQSRALIALLDATEMEISLAEASSTEEGSEQENSQQEEAQQHSEE